MLPHNSKSHPTLVPSVATISHGSQVAAVLIHCRKLKWPLCPHLPLYPSFPYIQFVANIEITISIFSQVSTYMSDRIKIAEYYAIYISFWKLVKKRETYEGWMMGGIKMG